MKKYLTTGTGKTKNNWKYLGERIGQKLMFEIIVIILLKAYFGWLIYVKSTLVPMVVRYPYSWKVGLWNVEILFVEPRSLIRSA